MSPGSPDFPDAILTPSYRVAKSTLRASELARSDDFSIRQLFCTRCALILGKISGSSDSGALRLFVHTLCITVTIITRRVKGTSTGIGTSTSSTSTVLVITRPHVTLSNGSIIPCYASTAQVTRPDPLQDDRKRCSTSTGESGGAPPDLSHQGDRQPITSLKPGTCPTHRNLHSQTGADRLPPHALRFPTPWERIYFKDGPAGDAFPITANQPATSTVGAPSWARSGPTNSSSAGSTTDHPRRGCRARANPCIVGGMIFDVDYRMIAPSLATTTNATVG
jgi:hypothetical protein